VAVVICWAHDAIMARPSFRRIRLDQLNLPQPALRSGRHKLHELIASIEEVGVLVPLVVRAIGEREYALIAGAGRLEALQRTGAGPSSTVPCVVVDADDAEATLLSLVENTVREPMRPFDEAEAARVLVKEYGYTQTRVSKAMGASQGLVSQYLAVFELDRSVVNALRKGEIEMRTAYALMPLKRDKKAQRKLLTRIRKEKLSARDVSAIVAAKKYGKRAIAPLRYAVPGAGRVDARTTKLGKVRVTLEANDREQLTKLWNSFKKKAM
jgi:ParB family chromosome partitioning protein